jgi:hypothetical protein
VWLKIIPKVAISLCDIWTHPLSCALPRCSQRSPGYSDVQAKVRDATSNDPWGPSGTQMNEIAQLTYNQSVPQSSPFRPPTSSDAFRNDFVEIMEMLDKRLNDKGKNWRHVFKVSVMPCRSSSAL